MIDAWPGLARAAVCGPFFDVARWAGNDPGIDDADWHPMTEFAEHPLGLPSRVDAVRGSLLARGFGGAGASSAVAARVAASVALLGLAARLLSPVIGSAVTTGVVPDLGWQRLHWRPASVGVLPLAIGPVTGQPLCRAGGGPTHSDARVVLDSSIAAVLRLGDVVAGRFLVSPRVVAGNVASAVVGAAAVASRSRPMAAPTRSGETIAGGLVTELLADGELAGTGAFIGTNAADPRTRFRRRSCCLLYRVKGAALCGDCVLHDRSGTAAG